MRKIKKGTAIFLCFFFLLCNVTSAAAYTTLFQSVKETPLNLGVVHKQYSILTDGGWITANVVEADMTKSNLGFKVLTSDNGVQNLVTVKTLAQQNNAIAATNADFFLWASGANKGSPIGTVVKDGQLISTPAATENMVSFYEGTDGIFKSEHLGFNITLAAPNGNTLRVLSLNKYSDLTDPAIYDKGFGKTYVSNYPNIIKVVIVNDIVQQITDAEGEFEIPQDGYILACLSDKTSFVADNLKVGDKVDRTMYLYPGLAGIKTAIGAGTMLVNDGAATSITHGDSGRNPRTAIGTDQSGKKLFMITVDGRQTSSVGMTLKELQDFMIQIGVYSGVNFDGGGSTTLAARPLGEQNISVYNSISDASPRAVTNAVGIVPTTQTGPLSNLHITSDRQNVFAGTSAILWSTGLDQNYNPVPVTVSDVKFSSPSGDFNGNIFKPSKTGTADITGNLNGAQGTMQLNVLDKPHALAISPAVIDLTKDNNANITVTGKDKDGYSSPIQLSDLKVTLDGNVAAVDGNTIQKTGSQNGVLKVEFGDVTGYALVKTSNSAPVPSVPNNTYLTDPQMTNSGDGLQFAVFGNMNKPGTLIEQILTNKALNELKNVDLVTFVGKTDSDTIAPVSDKTFSAKNYSMDTKDNSAFIILNDRNDGLKNSVASQWPWFVGKCNSLEQKNLFVMLPNEVYGGFKDARELDAFFSILEGLVAKGRNVYLFANDSITNSQRRNGIRYITTNGILSNYSRDNLPNQIAQTQYILVTISGDNVTYQLKSLF